MLFLSCLFTAIQLMLLAYYWSYVFFNTRTDYSLFSSESCCCYWSVAPSVAWKVPFLYQVTLVMTLNDLKLVHIAICAWVMLSQGKYWKGNYGPWLCVFHVFVQWKMSCWSKPFLHGETDWAYNFRALYDQKTCWMLLPNISKNVSFKLIDTFDVQSSWYEWRHFISGTHTGICSFQTQ